MAIRHLYYQITLRCEHVTRDGTTRSSRIGYAYYNEGDAEYPWHVTGPYTSTKRGPNPDRQRRHFARGVTRTGAHYQGVAESGKLEDDRVEIECATCRSRIVTRQQRLVPLLERLRLADVHTLTLAQLRANL